MSDLSTAEYPESAQNRERLAKWFRRPPRDAFLLLDQAQMVMSPTWKEKDLEALDQACPTARCA